MVVADLCECLVVLVKNCNLFARLPILTSRAVLILVSILNVQQISRKSLVVKVMQHWCDGVDSAIDNDKLWGFNLIVKAQTTMLTIC